VLRKEHVRRKFAVQEITMIHLCLTFSAQLRGWGAGSGAVALAQQYAINRSPYLTKVETLFASALGRDCRVRSGLAAFAGTNATGAAVPGKCDHALRAAFERAHYMADVRGGDSYGLETHPTLVEDCGKTGQITTSAPKRKVGGVRIVAIAAGAPCPQPYATAFSGSK
jgi:hypothetical protein